MTKQEMLSASAKVAEHFLSQGVSERAFKKMSKAEITAIFPQASDLIEVREDDYEKWAEHNKEERSLNYFKSLVAFDMIYLQKKK